MKSKFFLFLMVLLFLIPLACTWSSTSTPAATATQTPLDQPNVSISYYTPDSSSEVILQATSAPEITAQPDIEKTEDGGDPPEAGAPPEAETQTEAEEQDDSEEMLDTEEPDEAAVLPEEVVYNFLTYSGSDSDSMEAYLSENLQDEIGSDDVMEFLGLEGELQGLAFLSGSSGEDHNQAYVEVALQVDDEQVYRGFTLVRSDGNWLIDAVEVIEP